DDALVEAEVDRRGEQHPIARERERDAGADEEPVGGEVIVLAVGLGHAIAERLDVLDELLEREASVDVELRAPERGVDLDGAALPSLEERLDEPDASGAVH